MIADVAISRARGAFCRLALSILLLCGSLLPAFAQERSPDRTGDFDFYVLALSWAPTHCRIDAPDRPCLESGRAFTLHGLWPQYEHGFPDSCRTDEPYNIPRSLASAATDLFPDRSLLQHEWRKHGTCMGLDQKAYLDKLREAVSRVRIPPLLRSADAPQYSSAREVENAFVVANPGLSPAGIALACKGQAVQEVRICMTRNLDFRRCAEVDRAGCQRNRVVFPAASR
ncbi:ribonuclease T2 [Faunimonas pinastri]|uniref:Ribonuclease T2 n=1 Tax=Faunimonas pinastri TaxID=1855383 RepID=A0A1H9AUX9_9HYPH|nr:ribonuclease T2 [Faunimonas pinastri]SEP80301.1 ribonuclease T2 [Faunimonas pinastri]